MSKINGIIKALQRFVKKLQRFVGKECKPQTTHILHLDGVGGFVSDVRNGGKEITVTGWMQDHWKFSVGDIMKLIQKDGSRSTYGIKNLDRPGDPPDMYFMRCKFVGGGE